MVVAAVVVVKRYARLTQQHTHTTEHKGTNEQTDLEPNTADEEQHLNPTTARKPQTNYAERVGKQERSASHTQQGLGGESTNVT